jgi:hypothetical protein
MGSRIMSPQLQDLKNLNLLVSADLNFRSSSSVGRNRFRDCCLGRSRHPLPLEVGIHYHSLGILWTALACLLALGAKADS